MDEETWRARVRFHGHSCPGLAIGCRAAEFAMDGLGISMERAKYEELVCVTENDACGVDAIQRACGSRSAKATSSSGPGVRWRSRCSTAALCKGEVIIAAAPSRSN